MQRLTDHKIQLIKERYEHSQVDLAAAIDAADLIVKGATDKHTAQQLKGRIGIGAIYNIRRLIGAKVVTHRYYRGLTPKQIADQQRLLELKKQGFPNSYIAQQLGVDTAHVASKLWRLSNPNHKRRAKILAKINESIPKS